MGLTFDSPVSSSYSAYDKANKHSAKGVPLPSKTKRRSLSSSLANFLGRSASLSSPTGRSSHPVPFPSSAASSQIFRLPLAVREKIYGYVLGHDAVFHVLLKRKNPRSYHLGYRECRADGNRNDCIIANCRPFCDVVNGVYFGSFNSCTGLLLCCRDMSREAGQILYERRAFDFDHPLSLLLFASQISPNSLKSIKRISLDLGKHLFDPKSSIRCKSFSLSQWVECWQVISNMQGLEEIRVRFQSPVEGWIGMTEEEVLRPLWNVQTPLRVFEVEARTEAKQAFDDDEEDSVAPYSLIRDVQFPRP